MCLEKVVKDFLVGAYIFGRRMFKITLTVSRSLAWFKVV
jgi:hypothetical protein